MSELDGATQAIVDGSNALGADVFAASLAAGAGTANVLQSAFSLSAALRLALVGASGANVAEMRKVMHLGNLSADEVIDGAAGLNLHLRKQAGKSLELLIANGVFVREDILPSYVATVQKRMESEAAQLSSAAQVNEWCASKTKGMITEILQDVTPDIRAVLLNAIYFKASWKTPFDPKHTDAAAKFTLADGTPKPCSMMHHRDKFMYKDDKHGQMVMLPYSAGSGHAAPFAMLVFLPAAGSTTADKDASTLFAKFKPNGHGFHSTQGHIGLPKFKLETTSMLAPTLAKLGLQHAFKAGAFDGIGSGLFLSEVIQKVVVEVDEKGTVAAAVTAVTLARSVALPSQPPFEMVCDRPFYFAIVEINSGAHLFQGRVSQL